LRIRFGNANNAERYRAELSTRKRGVGETTQSVYSDIRRLLSLAFPAQHGEMYEAIGKDYFLNALNDPALRIRVLDRQPKTLDETLAIVTQMEAYSKVTSGTLLEGTEPPEKRKVRFVSPVRENEADQRIKALEEIIEKQTQEIKKIKQQANRSSNSNAGNRGDAARRANEPYSVNEASQPRWSFSHCMSAPTGHFPGAANGNRSSQYCTPNVGQPVYDDQVYYGSQYGPPVVNNPLMTGQSQPLLADVQPSTNQPSGSGFVPRSYGQRTAQGGRNWSYRGSGRSRRPYTGGRVPYDTCSRCFGRGHWRAECPVVGYQTADQPSFGRQADQSAQPGKFGSVKLLTGSDQSETYVDVTMRGRTFAAMLDTGCGISVCPYRMCKSAKIVPVQTELFAANETPISVLGLTRVYFEIGGVSSHADMLVSDDIQEFLLGFNYLKENNCEWLFAQNRIVINGHSVPLRSRPNKGAVRRVYVKESVTIPADTAMNVPVKLPFQNMRTPKSDWLSEARQVRPGLLAARTLLPHSSKYSAVTFLNMSGKDQAVRPGLQLGEATAVSANLVRPFAVGMNGDATEFVDGQSATGDVSADTGQSVRNNPDNVSAESVVLSSGTADLSRSTASDLASSRVADADEVLNSPVDGRVVEIAAGEQIGDELHAYVDQWSAPSADTLGGLIGVRSVGPGSMQGGTSLTRQAEPHMADSDNESHGGPGCESADPIDADVTELKAHMADSDISSMNGLGSHLDSDKVEANGAYVTDSDASSANCFNNGVVVNTVSSDDVEVIKADDYAHVQPVIDRLPPVLTPEQREQAVALIKRNSDIFSTHEFDVGCTTLLTASIETGDHPPIAEPLRRHARVHLDVIDETISKMEKAGIV